MHDSFLRLKRHPLTRYINKQKALNTCLYTIVPIMALATASASHAGNMYIYKDNNGQVLLTNVNPSGNFNKFTQRVKVTYYPESRIQSGGTDSSTSTSSASINGYRGFSTPSNSANRNAYDSYIRASAARHGVDPALIKAMMHTESAFNPNARSPVGAQGLMQLMPATARRFSVSNPWNPAENIEGAAKYIAWLTRRFNGNIEHVVAGYNAGEGNVDKYRGIPPFRETQDYVKRVLGRYNNIYRLEFNAVATNTPVQSSTRNANILPASYTTNQVVFSDSQPQQPSSYAQSAYAALR